MFRKIIAAILAFLPALALAATITNQSSVGDTTTSPNASGAFTPTAGALLIVGVCMSGSQGSDVTATSSVGGDTFTQVEYANRGASHGFAFFVADQMATASSQTITITAPTDDWTGTNIMVGQITGMTFDGAAAVLQAAGIDDFNSATTPDSNFSSSVLTGNPTALFLCNLSNPAGVTEPTSWTEGGDVGHTSVDHGGEWVYRNSGFTGTAVTWGSTSATGGDTFGYEFDTATGVPTFAVAPSCSGATNGVSCTYTASTASTLYGVGVSLGDGAPSCTQIKAGQNDGGTAALAAGSDANSGASDTISVTGTNPIPKMDYHFCLNNGGGDSTVDSSQVDELRTARSGYAFATIASISATGLCDLDSYYNPDCAVGDVFEYEDDTNEDADCNVSIGTDGELTLTPVGAGDCNNRRSLEYCPQDASSATTGLFTVPSCTFGTDDTIYVNNQAPDCPIDPESQVVLLIEDVAMSSTDLTFLGACSDFEADALTFAVTGGTLPVGTSLGGTGNKDWTGTPTTENEAGVLITVTVTDIAGATDTFQFTVYVVNTWTVPNCVTNTMSECADEIVTAAPWREFDIGLTITSLVCDFVNPDEIDSQNPAAAASATPLQEIGVVLGYIPTMPDVVGLPIEDALAAIEALCPP